MCRHHACTHGACQLHHNHETDCITPIPPLKPSSTSRFPILHQRPETAILKANIKSKKTAPKADFLTPPKGFNSAQFCNSRTSAATHPETSTHDRRCRETHQILRGRETRRGNKATTTRERIGTHKQGFYLSCNAMDLVHASLPLQGRPPDSHTVRGAVETNYLPRRTPAFPRRASRSIAEDGVQSPERPAGGRVSKHGWMGTSLELPTDGGRRDENHPT